MEKNNLHNHDQSENSRRQSAFMRASSINHLVSSVTIGPDSSYVIETATLDKSAKDPLNECCTKSKPHQRQNIDKTASAEDLHGLQRRLTLKVENQEIQTKVRNQLKLRAQKDCEFYRNLEADVEKMRLDTELKRRTRKEALDQKIEAVLKIEQQEELEYQQKRAELMLTSRKILEQQEKELRENLKQLNENFGKLEFAFNKIIQTCNPNMLQIVEIYKRQMEDIKIQKNLTTSSIDGLKKACINLEELCLSLISAIKDFEIHLQSAQKTVEEQNAISQSEKIANAEAQANSDSAKHVKTTSQPELQIKNQSEQLETNRYNDQLMQFLNEKQNATHVLSSAKELETLRFALKIAVNSPINLLNEQNASTLSEGFQKLHNLLSGQRIQTSKGFISTSDHQEANNWTKLRLAEKLIDVCDKKPETVFFVAALTVALWLSFPDFGQIFIAKLLKECPFLVPHRPLQKQGQSEEEYLKTWGYRVSDGRPEQYVVYQTRTSKFAALLAAIWITQSRRDDQSPNPCGISNAWKYLVNTFNSRPGSMYLHLLDKILEVAGATLNLTYGKQFVKLMVVLRDGYLPAVEQSVDESMRAAFDRLRIRVEKFFTECRFEQPRGLLPTNFW